MSRCASPLWLLLLALPAFSSGCSRETAAVPAQVLELTSDAQLFVDDYLIENMQRVWRTLNRPQKAAQNPILRSDRPWEGYLVLQPGTVIFDPQERLFKMWYNTMPTRRRPDVEQFLCYATSSDGIQWTKPDLGLVEFRGSKANNIVLKWSNWTHSVLKDSDDPDPSRRYKLLYWQNQDRERCGIWAAFSRDGKKWVDHPGNPVVPCWATGDTFGLFKDPVSKQFVLYHKTVSRPIRKVSRLVSSDFIHWRDSRQVLEPDQFDPPDTEFYGLSAFPYANQYLGMLWVYHTYTQFMDVQLVSSRDGMNWERSVLRRRFIPLLPDNNYQGDTFDSAMIYPANAPVLKDDRLWIYYSGFRVVHNTPAEDHDGQIGLGTLRQDGFVSLDATSEGQVLTRPLRVNGSSLLVNFEAHSVGGAGEESYAGLFTGNPEAGGLLRVEVQDAEGRPIPGYGAEQARRLKPGALYQEAAWEGGGLGALKHRTVRLKFILSNAKFYSFKIQ